MVYNLLALATAFVVISLFIVLTGVLVVHYKTYRRGARRDIAMLLVIMTALVIYALVHLLLWGYGYCLDASTSVLSAIFGIIAFGAYVRMARRHLREYHKALVYASLPIGIILIVRDLLNVYIASELHWIIHSVGSAFMLAFAVLFTFMVINSMIYLQKRDARKGIPQ